jgi:acetyl-CoA carboxylase alpha subunit
MSKNTVVERRIAEARKKVHKAIDEFADKVADRVVHELKESKATERKEHRGRKRAKK